MKTGWYLVSSHNQMPIRRTPIPDFWSILIGSYVRKCRFSPFIWGKAPHGVPQSNPLSSDNILYRCVEKFGTLEGIYTDCVHSAENVLPGREGMKKLMWELNAKQQYCRDSQPIFAQSISLNQITLWDAKSWKSSLFWIAFHTLQFAQSLVR